MKADQWMPLYVGDYLADTTHLSAEGHGAYLLLLMHQWRKGCIPSDPKEQARIVRLSGRAWRELSPTILAFFTDTEGGLKQMRLERVRDEQSEKIQRLTDRARVAGLASAAARKGNASSTQVALKPTEPEPEKKKENPSSLEEREEGRESAADAGSPDGEVHIERKPPPHPPMDVLYEMVAVWNELVSDHNMPQVSKITPQRAIHMRARCKERWNTDPVRQFRAYVTRICASPFLRGDNDRGWRADFDWALKPSNVLKVAEGRYQTEEGI